MKCWLLADWFKRFERSIAYRSYDRYNVIKTDLAPGYYDKDVLLLHACFTLLVDYVEIELAALHDIFGKRRPWHFNLRQFVSNKLVVNRSREAGDNYLHGWLSEVRENGSLAEYEAVRTIHTLYHWWKDIRPLRRDPADESGELAFYELLRTKYGSKNLFESMTKKELDKLAGHSVETNRIECYYQQEDSEKLKNLIDVRGYLWT